LDPALIEKGDYSPNEGHYSGASFRPNGRIWIRSWKSQRGIESPWLKTPDQAHGAKYQSGKSGNKKAGNIWNRWMLQFLSRKNLGLWERRVES
jgi:hypothetical protein